MKMRFNRLLALHNNGDVPSPLIHLFDEIWVLILKKLTPKEALNLRRVNKDFKAKVDNLYEDWNITLDEKCPYLDMILDLRLKEVTVRRLLNPMPNRPPGILKFPDILQTIHVRGYPGISAENLHIILQFKNLKCFSLGSISISEDLFWKTLDPLVGYNFSELHTLYIDFCPSLLNDLAEINFYEFFLTRSKMPKLKSIHVIWGETRYPATFRRLASALFLFMDRHGQTLKHFIYTHATGRSLSEFPTLDESALHNCTTLETFTIHSSGGTDCLLDTWIRLIQNQKKLVVLKISAHVPISKAMCGRMCANNFGTLTKFEFRGTRVESETLQYDLSVFSKCVNLKYLSLNLSPVMGDSNGEFFYNFETLPEQIETLVVFLFLIDPAEFSDFLKSHHSLLNLEISHVADSEGEFGVDSSVLEDILYHDSLKHFRIFDGCIAKPNTRSELKRLNKFFSDLGCTMAWNEFEEITLEKSSESNKWILQSVTHAESEPESESDSSSSDYF